MTQPIRRLLLALSILFVAVGVDLARAQGDQLGIGGRELIVGTKLTPPFALKDADGGWHGISIDLWDAIAKELGVSYRIREYDLEGLLKATENGEVDAAIGALTITAAREQVMDFTHPFYTTGFGIAVAADQRTSWFKAFQKMMAGGLLRTLILLILVLLVVGVMIWACERHGNPDDFGGSPVEGIWSGFWWAAVTLTTVGYGDKAPTTIPGRILTLVWMFAGIIFIGTVIAGMSSALTVSQLESPIQSKEDLARSEVATLAKSTSDIYLKENRIAHRTYPTLIDGLRAVARREVDAMVYDAPLLRYLANTELNRRVAVLQTTFDRQDYCIALPTDSALREPINRLLLQDSSKALLRDVLFEYLEQGPRATPLPN